MWVTHKQADCKAFKPKGDKEKDTPTGGTRANVSDGQGTKLDRSKVHASIANVLHESGGDFGEDFAGVVDKLTDTIFKKDS